ncbi:hypothetical protein COCCU_06275 [Corynebacterium occultum]|uniref:Activator of Hsp90 ATPase homologue 1/2-like C-terminal domain-containing protein n=1 Tax=Corynebacterium occultum TaxID=2675219 RepID=A0A6B8W0Z0_9CORY|nr:SRPBCC domain-containing protein [Corynebacterium occultum]QGU07194.1 hypothetical protein COCCU_06275 [Corynebacterium occultum]
MSRTDVLSRHISASPNQVYTALVDPKALCSWLPPEGWSCRFEGFVLSEEGGFRMIHSDQTSNRTDVLDAHFVEIIPEEKLVMNLSFESEDPDLAGTLQIIWELAPLAGGSLLTLSARNAPSGITAEGQRESMTTALANLSDYLTHQA